MMDSGVVRAAVLVGACGLLAGCKSDGGNGERTKPDASQETPDASSAGIGPAGGSLTLPDGARITLPAGAVGAGTEIHAEVTASPGGATVPSGSILRGSVYAFTPHGTAFQKPVKIRIPAGTARGAVYFLDDEQDSTWEPVEGTSLVSGFHEFSVTHISLFAELVTSAPEGGTDASVEPTPGDAGRSASGGDANDGSPSTTESPSCRGLPATCGPNHDESCCSDALVPGGTFDRGRLSGIYSESAPTTISSFRLDKYEVTVGRFRNFVKAFTAGWRPEQGSGKHVHLNGGKGLAQYPGVSNGMDFEAGWVAPHGGLYSDFVWPLPATNAAWNSRLLSSTGCDVYDDGGWLTNPGVVSCEFCDPQGPYPCFQTWTPEAGENETRPINQAQWIEAYAFCIWDGGFLPSEAEWQYAAMGGSENRMYPWGDEVPGPGSKLLVHGCHFDDRPDHQPVGDRPACTGIHNIAPVGSIPAGNGRWGHADLAGNMHEWLVESGDYTPGPACTDCAYLSACNASCSEGKASMDGEDFERRTGYVMQPGTTNGGGYFTLGIRCAHSP
jgi:formylglycine-generating enzyme required for sulfatase activity